MKTLSIFSEYCFFIKVLMLKLRNAAEFCVFSTTIFIYFVYAIAQPSSAPFPACKCVRHYLRTHNCDTHGRNKQTGATCSLILVTQENWAHLLWQFGLGKLLNIRYLHLYLGNNKHFTTNSELRYKRRVLLDVRFHSPEA